MSNPFQDPNILGHDHRHRRDQRRRRLCPCRRHCHHRHQHRYYHRGVCRCRRRHGAAPTRVTDCFRAQHGLRDALGISQRSAPRRPRRSRQTGQPLCARACAR
eukprot:8476734-Pyramimonas_sp.AAC.1